MRQPFIDDYIELVSKISFINRSHDLRDEGPDQHLARLFCIETTRAQVKEFHLVELTRRCAMTALHVIGVDFKLRFCIDLRIFREQQSLIELVSIRTLRIGTNRHLTLENPVTVTVEHSLKYLPATTARLPVSNTSCDIRVLATTRKIDPI